MHVQNRTAAHRQLTGICRGNARTHTPTPPQKVEVAASKARRGVSLASEDEISKRNGLRMDIV